LVCEDCVCDSCPPNTRLSANRKVCCAADCDQSPCPPMSACGPPSDCGYCGR
jgi:hypothetical protein